MDISTSYKDVYGGKTRYQLKFPPIFVLRDGRASIIVLDRICNTMFSFFKYLGTL